MSGRLAGRVAVVVGGGQTAGRTTGNGRAACLAYAREGAQVLVVDRDMDAATQTAQLVGEQGGRAHPHRADITSEDDCRGIPDAAISRFGRVDVLHNNVGILLRATTEALSVERWRWGFDVNLAGMWLTCKYTLPYFGVRVNAVAPGMIDTPMGVDDAARDRGATRAEVAAGRAATIPMRRQGTSWDVANASVFLASDDAGYITGVVLPVDGGSTLRFSPKGRDDGRS